MALDIRDEDGVITDFGARDYEAVSKIDELRKRGYLAIQEYNNDFGSKAGSDVRW